MDDISFVAAAGASAVFGLVLWWSYGRYQSALVRVLFTVVALLVGFLIYLILGIVFIVLRPEVARETGLALNHGIKTLTTMLLIVNAVVLAIRGPRKGRLSRK